MDSPSESLLKTIMALPDIGWYYGNITVEQAELLLKNEPNGAFLIRDSSDSENIRDIFTITFKIRNCFGSVRIDYAKGFFSLSLQDPGLPLFRTLMDLVSYCLERSVKYKQPVCILTGHSQHNNVNLYLTKAVSRYKQMHSLMYLCREAVHKYVTVDKFPKLGLPTRLVQYYITKNPFFDEQLHVAWDQSCVLDGASEETRSSNGSGSLQLDTAGENNRS